MPGYVENAEKWKTICRIDYFTYFITAWIAFNAWYKNFYPGTESDAEIINKIKTETNRVRSKIVALVEGTDTDNESRNFKGHLSNLHNQLERVRIENEATRITFLELVVDRNTKTSETKTYRRVTYKVEIDPANRKKITCAVTDAASIHRFLKVQNNGYNFAEIEAESTYVALSNEKQIMLKECYKEVNPRKPLCLLVDPGKPHIKIGSYQFVNDSDLIARAVIAVIYNLRNALFHGQIVPEKETQKVYEPAYQILATLVEIL